MEDSVLEFESEPGWFESKQFWKVSSTFEISQENFSSIYNITS